MDEILGQLGGLLLGSVPTIIFIVLLYLSYKALVHKPMVAVLAERRSRTEGAIEKARADIAQAEADGYVNIDIYESGEGLHYVNFALVDANFEPERPEVLLYAPVPHENRMELVAVEYVVPLSLSSSAPAGFAGDADVWRENSEGLGLWELNAWIWLNNSNGIFAFHNPRVP